MRYRSVLLIQNGTRAQFTDSHSAVEDVLHVVTAHPHWIIKAMTWASATAGSAATSAALPAWLSSWLSS